MFICLNYKPRKTNGSVFDSFGRLKRLHNRKIGQWDLHVPRISTTSTVTDIPIN